jgi:hypothetical protein
MSKDSTASNGIGFGGLLTIVFITLKLTKVIAWSWWWVLSPILIPIGLYLIFIIFCLVMAGISYLISKN